MKDLVTLANLQMHMHTSRFLQPATWVSYYDAGLLWVLQVGVPLRVLRGYSDATVTGATTHAVASEYLYNTLNGS